MARHQCLFCESPADSREDIIPVWIQNKMKGKRVVSLNGFSGERLITKQGFKSTFRVTCVCSDCNEGWMSRLEATTKPLLSPLIDDLSIPLDARRQCVLATWAMKTAITGETLGNRRERRLFYTHEECSQFRQSTQFPGYTVIWVGRYTGKYDIGFFCIDAWDKKPEDPRVIHAYVNTILTGKFLFHIISLRVPPEYGHRTINLQHSFGPWDHLLSKLSLNPADGGVLAWPPALTFSDDGNSTLQSLVQRCSLGVPIAPLRPAI
jgi:hypothetical protein